MGTRIEEEFARLVNAHKAAGPMTAGNSGGARMLTGRRFVALLNETVNRSNVLRHGCRMATIAPGQSTIDFLNFDGQFWQHVPEDGDAIAVSREPTYREVDVDPGHYKMDLELTRYAQRRVQSLTGSDLKAQAREGFKAAFGNSMARTLINGDKTSSDSGLNGSDGICTRAEAGGMQIVDLSQVIGGVRVAQSYDATKIYPRALEALERPFRSKALRLYTPPDEIIHYGNWKQAQHPSADTLVKQILDNGMTAGPWGMPVVEVDHWPELIGPNGAPTAVVDDGDGTMTVRVATILPDAYDAGADNRRVRITLKATGAYELCTVAHVGGQNLIYTTGALGQTVISAVASDYDVQVADERSLILSDPNNLVLALADQILALAALDSDKPSEITKVHCWMDSVIVRPEAAVLLKGYFYPNLAA